MKTFHPPIQSRKTNALIKILAIPQDWDVDAVEQAEAELLKRGVEFGELVEREKYLHSQREKLSKLRGTKASYSIGDFLESPILFLIEVLFDSNLKREGYLRKAKQQKIFRTIALVATIIICFYVFINSL